MGCGRAPSLRPGRPFVLPEAGATVMSSDFLRRFSTDKAQHVVASMLNRSSFAQRSTPHQASRLSGSTLATAPPEHSRPTLALSCKGALPSEDDSLMTDGMDRLPGGSPMQLKRVTREARNKCDASCTWSRLFGESI